MGVSVVVAVFNLERYVLECLESVAAQDVDDLEIIVIDDASKDGSLEIIRAWAERQPSIARVIAHDTNQGVLRAFNHGLRACTKDYLSLLDGDDTLEPGILRSHCSILDAAGPAVAVVFGDMQLVAEDGSPLDTECFPGISRDSEDVYLQLIENGSILPLIGTVMRRSVVTDLGGFDETLSYLDWPLWLGIARNHRFRCSHQRVGQYRQHPQSFSRAGAAQLRLARIDILTRLLRQHPSAAERQAIKFRARVVAGLIWAEDDGPEARAACRRLACRSRDPRLMLLAAGMSMRVPCRQAHRVAYWSKRQSWRAWWQHRRTLEP